jgi:hypothetical protein
MCFKIPFLQTCTSCDTPEKVNDEYCSNETHKIRWRSFYGLDCVEKFGQWVFFEDPQMNKNALLMGHNSAGFD